MKQTDSRLPQILYWLALTLLAGLPLILVVALRAEVLVIASESLAYRFFYSCRILHGEGGNIWFLQGYLVSAAQNAFLFLSGADGAAGPELRWAFQIFSWSTLALNLAVLATAAALVAFVRGLDWSDRVLLALVGVGPMYMTTGQGFQFSLWPDYYHLNVALCALGVAFFQVAWRRPEFARHACWAFASGLFSGLATANKITAGGCGAAFMLLLIFRPGLRPGAMVGRGLLATLGVGVGCAWPILSFYQGDPAAATEAFRAWLTFMKSPGGDGDFYAQMWAYLFRYHLAYFFGLYLIPLALLVPALIRRPQRLPVIIATALTVLGLALIYSVIKRPAGTSLFEGAVFTGGFGAVMLTMLPASRLRSATITAFVLLGLYLSVVTFPWREQVAVIAATKDQAGARWAALHLATEAAQGRRVIFFIPDNRYHAQDLFIMLLKGTADMGTWSVGDRGRPTLHRFSPGLEFRSNHSAAPPNLDGTNAVYIWNDTQALPSCASFFPELDAAVRRHPDKVRQIDLRTGQSFHLLDLP